MTLNSAIATAADYADALFAGRRMRTALVLILATLLVVQVVVFFVAHTSDVLNVQARTIAATLPASSAPTGSDLLAYASGIALCAGLLAAILLPLVLLLITHVMLVGRLLGVGAMVSALLSSLVLLVMMIPWQTMFVTRQVSVSTFVIPGVLWSWNELSSSAKFTQLDLLGKLLGYTRFVAAPLLALALLLRVHLLSTRALRLALGETRLSSAAAEAV